MANPLKVIFAGTPEFAAAHLRALLDHNIDVCAVYTQPDRPSGRGKKLTPSPVKVVAESAGIAVHQPASLRGEAEQETLAALDADVMIVVAYGLILPQAVLDAPRFGCINVHASLLPRWRGAAPIQRAIESGDTETGVTIMGMEAGLDTGPMISKVTLPILTDTTGGSLHDSLAKIGPPALLEVLADIKTKLQQAEIQDDSLANYAHKINKAECEIDWRQEAEAIALKIRAFDPAPGCFSELDGQRIKIWAAAAIAGNGEPGMIINSGKDGLIVACGDGALNINSAQFPGAKRQSIADIMNARAAALPVGAIFSLPAPSGE